MTNSDVFWGFARVTAVVVGITEMFFIFVWNPAAVRVGEIIRVYGHSVEATNRDVIWSYIFPIFYGFGAVIVCTVFVAIVDLLWKLFIQATWID